jgi:eukaryotic-like serine/threonine-protein kinase
MGSHSVRKVRSRGESTLDRVGPGSVLSGRYVLKQRLDDVGDTSTWQAHDDTLDRRVFLRLVSGLHPHAATVMDAARQAASVEDPRLSRVLDVGEDGDTTFVVTEWLGVPSLAQELRAGPLAPEEARIVVGEAALALEIARHRGLHHLRLTPAQVYRLDDGSMRVTELAVAAALAGLDVDRDGLGGGAATAQDTRDLVALTYATLTGTWPLGLMEGGPCDLPGAPLLAGRPVPPGQVTPGVPADLDALCSQTFGGSGPPASPGELAGRIAPWGRERGSAVRAAFEPASAMDQTTVFSPAQLTAPPTPPMVPVVGAGAHHGADGYPTGVGQEPQWNPSWAAEGGPSRRANRAASASASTSTPQKPRTAIALVLGFVAVFVLLAYCGLRGLGGNPFGPPKSGPTAGASATPGATEDPTTTGASGQPIQVSAGRGFDPQGDGSERDGDASKAFDGNPSTAWNSQTYKSAEFGGLKKGVGLQLNLGGQQNVTQVEVQFNGSAGAVVELRTASGDQLGAQVLATGQVGGGPLVLRPGQPVQTDNLVLWFTTAASFDDGYRVEVTEVRVS